MKVLRYGLIVLGVVLLIIIVTPFLIPAEQIRQVVEKEATKAAGMPVKVETLSVSLLPPSLAITRLTVSDVKGGTPKMAVGSGSIAVELMPLFDGKVETSGITFRDIALRVSEAAKGKNVHVVHIDKVTGAVRLDGDRLSMPGWKARLYGGEIRLDAGLAPLEGKKRALSGDMVASGIDILPLLKDAAGQDKVSGTFRSTLKFSAKGADEKALQRTLKVDGPMVLTEGKFEGVGLTGVAAMLVQGNVGGMGNTILFETFQTQLKVRGRDIYLRDIVLNASAFNANGFVDIKGGKLNGEIETSGMKGLAGTKLLVAGTTDSPRIYPAPSAVVGGAIGATIGGSAGAAVGSKIGGDAVESIGEGIKGLFGK